MTESTSVGQDISRSTFPYCHLSALQPLLSASYNSRQVASLLSLALLFWQRPTVTDTQLADSPLLYHEQIHPSDEILTPLLRDALATGQAKLLLRDAFYNNPTDKVQNCTNLVDVYRGWEKQAMPEAWVVPPNVTHRARYVENWSSAVPPQHVLTYDYLQVKRNFQSRARGILGTPILKSQMPATLSQELAGILQADWFSHSAIYALFRKYGQQQSDWATLFGLFDEAAYSDYVGGALAAINLPLISKPTSDGPLTGSLSYINRIMSERFQTIDVGDLSLLHLLTFDDIMRVRERGSHLYDSMRVLAARPELEEGDLVELSMGLASYWRTICDEIVRLHPGAAKTRTRIGLLVAQQSLFPIEDIIDGVAFVLSALASIFTGGSSAQSGIIRRAIETASFRFILQTDRPELKRLRSVFSRNAVISTQNSIGPPPKLVGLPDRKSIPDRAALGSPKKSPLNPAERPLFA